MNLSRYFKLGGTLLLFFLSCSLFAQERENRPLPVLAEQPYFVLKDSIKGWSRSKDGQWISEPKTIPVIGISQNEEFYQKEEHQLGLDNFLEIRAYRIKYGDKELLCLVKLYQQGKYKYPARKRGWKTYTEAHYFVVEPKDWVDLKNHDDGEVHVIRIPALDGGKLPQVDPDALVPSIRESFLLREDYDRNLVVTFQVVDDPKRTRFQIASLHEIFPDVEGVRKNFTRQGRTVYGSTQLFDYLYYEVDYYRFQGLLDPPSRNQGEANSEN